MIGQVTAARIRHEFVLEALGEQALKNVSELVRAYRLVPPGIYKKVGRGSLSSVSGTT